MSELSDIQKLIRLKRYEQPPEGYFDDFLFEFQRRQRAEMLKRPLWQIAWERANLWLESFRVPAIAYASILVAAIGVTGVIVNSQNNAVSSASLASAGASVLISPSAPVGQVAPASTSGNIPHSYVLEKRPVSYDAPFSF
jgi:hypothetical protein